MTRVRGAGGIEVDGIVELSRALKAIDTDLPKELRKANKEIADDVASHARSKALSLGGVAAKTAPSVRSSAGVQSASVGFGGSEAPYGAGAEFGGRGRPTTMQFQPHLGRTGYFVYPTIREDSDKIEARWMDAADDLIRKHFPQ